MTNSCVIHASPRLGFGLVGPRALSLSSAWEGSRGAGGGAEKVEGGGRLIRHGARAQSPPLDIMCLPAARTRTHHLPRVYVRVRALLCRPPKCIRSIIGFSLSYDTRSPDLPSRLPVQERAEICSGSRSAHARRGNGDDGPPSARNADREKIDGRHSTRVVRQFRSFRPRALEARGARKRARRHGALLTISRDCRSHPRSPPLVCHPTNSLSAARARGAKCVCDARARSHARLLHLSWDYYYLNGQGRVAAISLLPFLHFCLNIRLSFV